MTFIKKTFHSLDKIFSNELYLNDYIKKILGKNKISIIDVGASGILEKNKFNIRIDNKFTEISKFDDNLSLQNKNNKLFNKILWSEEKDLDFYIRKNQVSSSLYKTNNEILKDFDNFSEHEVIESIKVKSSKIFDIKELIDIDLIKIDAEGAELEILRGMESKLDSVFVIELEAQFIERYIGSPLFFEINKYLTEKDFEIFLINQEAWIRNKKNSNINSNHKIIWADVVYFKKVSSINSINNYEEKNIPEKFIISQVFYNLYDEAHHSLNFFEKNCQIKKENAIHMREFIDKNIKSNLFILSKVIIKFLFSIIVLIFSLFIFKYRKQGIAYFKTTFKSFFHSIGNLFKLSNKNSNVIRDDRIN